MTRKTRPLPSNNNRMSRTQRVAKDNERRRKKKRRRDFMLYLILAVFAISVAIVLSLTVFFHIEKIEVVGDSLYYSNDEIIKASTISLGENLFLSDINNASMQIEKQLPYIGEAVLKRHMPNKIVISVRDAIVSLVVQKETSYVFFDDNGKVLDLSENSMLPDTGALVKGITVLNSQLGEVIEFEQEGSFELLNALVTKVRDLGFENITEFDLSDIFNIKLVFDDRITLLLGSVSNLDNKLQLGKATVEKENESNIKRRLVIDLRIEKEAHVRAVTQESQKISNSTEIESSSLFDET